VCGGGIEGIYSILHQHFKIKIQKFYWELSEIITPFLFFFQPQQQTQPDNPKP